MPREAKPRCGRWMPRSQAYCGLPQGHYGGCRTVAASRAHIWRTTSYKRQRVTARRADIDAYKLERGCERCGYREHAVALDLDHIDPAAKVADVSALLRYASWDEVLAELAKCRVLCAVCHRIVTHLETPEAAATGSDDGLATR